ncbi:MAG: YitT family protein [Marinomonas atlantica]|nr:YitT family protein [Marinomonas atlantica]
MKLTHQWLSILEGCILVALGLHILNSVGLLISGTAGIGMILLKLTSLSFGQLFFVLNLPFYILAWRALGKEFAFRTFAAVSILSLLSELFRYIVHLEIHPIAAAILGGMLVGFGLIILFRHNASLGGLNILAVYLERRFNIHASRTTLIADLCVLSVAVLVLDGWSLLYSLLAFLLLSSVVGRYHRPPKWAQNNETKHA